MTTVLRRRSVLGLLAAVAVVVPLGAGALDLGDSVFQGAQVTERAVRLGPETPADLVSIYNSGALKSDVENKAIAAAVQAGGTFAVRDAATIGMTRVRRDGTDVQVAPASYAYPMGTTVLRDSAIAALMGGEVSVVMDADSIVMSALTASFRGAQAGDVVTLVAGSGALVDFEIGAVVADEVTGGTELLMTPDAAARIGLERNSSVVIWGFPSRDVIDQAMADQGLVSTSIRIRRSWDPRDPDSTLGMARAKEQLGEFAYRVNGNGSVSIDSGWTAANLPPGRRVLNPTIPINARCHLVVEPAIEAALAEVAAAGLGWTINVYDANRAGGCYNPRFSRSTPSSSIGFLSRHTWGMALDTNTVGSCFGCAPPDLDCRTVRIFRKHGFAWGGNFLTPDGMHFEYVGERRDELPYPSRYCANDVGAALIDPDAEVPIEMTERPWIFDDAGLADLHGHDDGHDR